MLKWLFGQTSNEAAAVNSPSGKEGSGSGKPEVLNLTPETITAAVLELPKEETAAWVAKAADAGVEQIWIHQMTDTPEALAEAEQRGLKVITGHCAVMYNVPGFSMHAPHRWIWKMLGKY